MRVICVRRAEDAAAIATTAICLALALPIAWYVVCQSEARRRVLLFVVTLPFWINTLIRTYCWILILRDEGVANQALRGLGVIGQPLLLLYNDGAILLGLVYTFLPFMVLPIYATLERMDGTLLEAAADLGCPRWKAFWLVTVPLALPGVVAGSILCFIPIVGEFVIPDLLGGSGAMMIGQTLWLEFFSNRDWPVASAVAIALLMLLLIPIAWLQRAQAAEARA